MTVIADVSCSSDQFYSASEKSCKCKDDAKQVVDGQCTSRCQEPLIFSQIAARCVCPPDYIDSDGDCFKCEGDKKWSTETKKCECQPPLYEKDDG